MRRGLSLFLALGLVGTASGEPGTAGLMQEAVTAYREGRLESALLKMGEIIDREPANATAKNYIWAIARRIQKEQKEARLSPREIDRAVILAQKDLEERRLRTQETLAAMRESARRSGNVRSPADVLAGASGLERFIGKELEGELADVQVRAFADQIVSHLEEALGKKVFVSLKDQYRAEGYLAYVREDWGGAAASWEKALKEDPSDAEVRKDLESLQALVQGREKKEKLAELSNQARLYFRSGRYTEALEAWQGVARLDKEFPGLLAQTAAARTALEKSRLQGRLKAMTEEGLTLYRNGDVFGAAQRWLEVLQADPSNEEAREWLQHAGARMRVPAAAPAAPAAAPLREAPPKANPEKAMALYKEGMILYAQGSLPEAVRAWEECLRLDPSLNRAREALRQANAEIQFK